MCACLVISSYISIDLYGLSRPSFHFPAPPSLPQDGRLNRSIEISPTSTNIFGRSGISLLVNLRLCLPDPPLVLLTWSSGRGQKPVAMLAIDDFFFFFNVAGLDGFRCDGNAGKRNMVVAHQNPPLQTGLWYKEGEHHRGCNTESRSAPHGNLHRSLRLSHSGSDIHDREKRHHANHIYLHRGSARSHRISDERCPCRCLAAPLG